MFSIHTDSLNYSVTSQVQTLLVPLDMWQLHLLRMQIRKRLPPHALGASSLVIIVWVQLHYAQMVRLQV